MFEPNMALKTDQDGPKTAPRTAKSGPRAAQERPRAPQDRLKSGQEASWEALGARSCSKLDSKITSDTILFENVNVQQVLKTQ